MRSMLVLLLLVVFFLTGLVLGMDRGQKETGLQEKDSVRKESVEHVQVTTVPKKRETDKEVIKAEPPETLAQKTASFMENSVKGFYNVVVELLYSFVRVFFE
ncbi:hypothetical protein [Virgibacillus siamensis]|uniref:hypothetical protein n=1 Tax=Virgibacillus siamensis TaxID=480071 RepID=UPI000986C383|nr:hypothetical protein [Virgibacillus siamensis]